jgi:hypothetical protein
VKRTPIGVVSNAALRASPDLNRTWQAHAIPLDKRGRRKTRRTIRKFGAARDYEAAPHKVKEPP